AIGEIQHEATSGQSRSIQAGNRTGSCTDSLKIERHPVFPFHFLWIIQIKPQRAGFFSKLLGASVDIFRAVKTGADTRLDEFQPMVFISQDVLVVAERKSNPWILAQA